MDINKMVSKGGLKWRCKKHPNFPCELICLDGDCKDRVMCFNCAQQQQIPFSNLITMSSVLSANEYDILQGYPPLKDQELSEKIRKTSLQQSLDEMEAYFKKLREDIEKEIKAAEQRAKQSLIKKEKENQELLEIYQRIAEIDKLKTLIVSEKESAEKDLDDFIKEKWSKAEDNRGVMADLMNQQETEQYFASDEPSRIAQRIIENLKTINSFEQSISQKINLIKSTYGSSQNMEIIKLDDSIYQLKQISRNAWDQVFIDPILNPNHKYILHIELETKSGNDGYINFGLLKDEGKDNDCGYKQYMCYQDNSNNFGISKYIKGNPMQYGSRTGKHSFEVRIHLSQKFLRVASLPDDSSIAQLNNPNKINPNVAYRFFLSMNQIGDVMRITHFRTVNKYDEKM